MASILTNEMGKAGSRIILIYALHTVEFAINLLYPALIGIAINGLLGGDRVALVPLLSVWIAHIAIAFGRQIYDTIVFSNVAAKAGTELARTMREGRHAAGELSARVDMATDYLYFFEKELPSLLAIVVALAGSAAMLFVYDWLSGLITAALLIPAGIINIMLARRAKRYNIAINDQAERQVDLIAHGRTKPIRRHFLRIARFKIYLSRADAWTWSFVEVLTMGVFLGVIARLATLPDASAGAIFAGLAYLLRIIDQLDNLPEMMTRIGRLLEIRSRMGHITSDQPQ